ncbi:hypothetical protein V8G54_033710 [Vigna mungo]|uniref:glycerophosphodiester phosphodiesterase n=1 Tax=Vigna mungo TaxID=3915 RepID=A0AAQ3MNW6_VIGMU
MVIVIKTTMIKATSLIASSIIDDPVTYIIKYNLPYNGHKKAVVFGRFARSVVIKRGSLYLTNEYFLTGSTKTVSKLKSSNLSVYVQIFNNEYVSQRWDFMSDPTVQINTFVQDASIDGIITGFLQTANRYRRNKCLNLGNSTPNYMKPVEIGGLFRLIDKSSLPPAMAPIPPLIEANVTEPPLAPSSEIGPSSSITRASGAQPTKNAQAKVVVCFTMFSLTVLVASLLL